MCADQTGRSDLPRGKRRTRARLTARWSRRAVPTGSPRDRGTILLMVLGVLALMAIIMVVYAAIGRSDRGTAAAQVRTRRLDDQVDSFARYLADVIGRDVLATYAQEDDRAVNTSNPLPIDPRLEPADIPDTDSMMVSQRDPEDVQWQNQQRTGLYAFNPEGSYSKSWRELNQPGSGQPATRRDPRGPSDPYLSSTEPIFVNRHSPDWTWRAFGYQTGATWTWNGPGEDYLNLRDWAHISNFAPSGNFVNLWSLRNNFRAKPGFRRPFEAADPPKLSDLLSTIDPETGYSYPIAVGARIDPDADILGAMRGGNLVSRVRLNRPADWTRDQIGAFRTTSELRQGNGTNDAPYGVDDPEFMPYQWVDADGDGFYDSRWIELVDIFDPDNPRSIVANAGRARLFLGVRAVDLTGLVNVNTAGDFTFQPRRTFAISKPADSDPADPLRSLGRPQRVRNPATGALPANAQLPPRLANPPINEVDVDPNDPYNQNNWVDYRRSVETSYQIPAGLTPADVDLQRLLRLSDNYYAFDVSGRGAGYLDLPQPPAGAGNTLAGDYRAYDPENQGRHLLIGNAAYQSIWQARQAALAGDRRFGNPDQVDPLTGDPPFIDTLRVAERRFAYYDNLGRRRDPARQRETGLLNRYGLAFDEADELELRTFQGVNDPDRTSRLETTVAGRYDLDPDLYSLSPLRDNRSAALERAGRDLAPRALASGPVPGANDPYRKALLAAQLDIRRLMTTVSGARPIIEDPVVALKVDRSGRAVDGTPREISDAAGNLRVDGSRLVSSIVETGNHSFHKQPNDQGPNTSDLCDWFDDTYNRLPPNGIDRTRNVANYVLANVERENIFDDLGWFEFTTLDEERPYFYQNLDNRPDPARRITTAPPPRPPNEPDPIEPPVGSIYSDVTRAPDSENFNTSRLELMREAFRAYASCLLPYTQWGADPLRPSDLNGPFPDAWTLSNNYESNPFDFTGNRPGSNLPVHQQPNLAYGGDPELAYRVAAHMAVNLRDAIDTDRRVELTRDPVDQNKTLIKVRDDHKPTAVSLDLTGEAMIDYTNNARPGGVDPLNAGNRLAIDQRPWWNGNVNSSYQRDRDYPWPRLNLDDRTTTTDDRNARTRMPRLPQQVTSTGHEEDEPVKRVNIFGIEPQPFITQVSALAMFVDSPPSPTYTPSGDVDECTPTQTVDDTSAPGGRRLETCDEASQRLRVDNQDGCRVTVSLTRNITGIDEFTNNSDFLGYVIAFQVTNPFDTEIVLEPEDPSTNDSWYYFEYANRFYRLCPKDYRQPFDGLRRNLTDDQRLLKPGESRVYYATYPNSLKDLSVRINRQLWAQFEWRGDGSSPTDQTAPLNPERMGEDADRETDPSLLVPVAERIFKHEFGENAVHVAPMYPETGRAIGALRSGTLGTPTTDRSHRLGNPAIADMQDGKRNIELFAIGPAVLPDVESLGDGPDFENTQVAGTNPERRQRLLDDLPEILLSSNGPTWSAADKIMVESDPRRRVLLWRVMRDPDFVDGGPEDVDPQLIARALADPNQALKPNWIGNDYLVDRLYDPAPVPVLPADRLLRDRTGTITPLESQEQFEIVRAANGSLVQALIAPFRRRLDERIVSASPTSSNIAIADTDNCIQGGQRRAPDETGFSINSWVSISRPTNPQRKPEDATDLLGREPLGASPVGALPPWCMEAKLDNVYEPGFTRIYSASLADANSGMTNEKERRSPSLNRVRKSVGVKRGPAYKNQSENHASTYYRFIREMVDVHTKQLPGGASYDAAYVGYPNDYENVNALAATATKFFDPDLATRFADRRGGKSLRPFDSLVNANSTSTIPIAVAAPKGDPRESNSIVEIDVRRQLDGAETDEFFNQQGAGRAGMKPRRFDEVAIEIHRLPSDSTGLDDPQPTGSRALFSRVGDFLLPLGIGPSYDPAAGYMRRRPDLGQGPIADGADPLNPISPPGTNPQDPNPQISGIANLRFARRLAMLDNQWTTLAEAIATAADYYSGPRVRETIRWIPTSSNANSTASRVATTPRNLYYRFARDTRGQVSPLSNQLTPVQQATVMVPKGDRGHLVLDAWSPYLDYNPGTAPAQRRYQWGPLDPNTGLWAEGNVLADAPLGSGIPLALNVLNKFRVAGLPGETRAKPNDPRLCVRVTGGNVRPLPTVGNQFARTGRERAYGSATSIEPGKININTAPQAVLRLLPMISPCRDLLDTPSMNVLDSFLYDRRHLGTAPDYRDPDALSLATPRRLPNEFVPAAMSDPQTTASPRSPAVSLWDPDDDRAQGAQRPYLQPWDIATTIDAYRHKLAMGTRRLTNDSVPIEVNYRDDRRVPGDPNPPAIRERSGRDDAFRINTEALDQGGLRDRRGFQTVGEVMALSIKASTDANVALRRDIDEYRYPERLPIDRENSITRLAHDGASNRSLAIDSVGYAQTQVDAEANATRDVPPLGRTAARLGYPSAVRPLRDSSDFQPTDVNFDMPVVGSDGLVDGNGQRVVTDGLVEGADTIADDYDEKLSIANAVLNSITVRSDIFGVWFVIHGYTPEDVLVDDGFPMVPSIAKRYFMVVDRSNVTTATGKPKILMLREVPTP